LIDWAAAAARAHWLIELQLQQETIDWLSCSKSPLIDWAAAASKRPLIDWAAAAAMYPGGEICLVKYLSYFFFSRRCWWYISALTLWSISQFASLQRTGELGHW
jgi:hypothetical protein